MTDIERRLRDLGERVSDEQGPSALQPEAVRAAKRRRLGTALTGLATVTALVFGASFAAANLGGQSDRFGTADDPTGTTTNILYSHLGPGERAEISFDVDGGQVCYLLASLDEYGTFTRVEIVKGLEEKSPVILSPPPYQGRSPDPGSRECVAGVDGAVLNEILVSPDDYFLLLEDPVNGERVSSLVPDKKVDAPACGPPVDFAPTYVPDGWIEELQAGSGGRAAWTTVGHYGNDAAPGTVEKARAGFADLVAGESPYPLNGSGQEIRVLDERALLGEIHEGFSVEFTQHECDYSLIAFGISRDELRRFAEGLRLPGEFEPAEESFGAIWPEDTAEEAEDACADGISSPTRTFRHDPMSTALEFGDAVLGWDDAIGIDRQESRYGSTIELRRSQSDVGKNADGPAVWAFTSELVPGCWSVVSVSRPPDDRPTGVSVSIQGRHVEIGFNDLGADSIYFEMGHGSYMISHDSEPADGRITALLTYKPDQTGHFLLLFKDEGGEVFSAAGGPLPAGDFAAG